MSGSDERFLVTGSSGCIGAWAVSLLVRSGVPVTAFDVSDDHRRLRLALDEASLDGVDFVQGDLRDLDAVVDVVDRHRITHVVHLAALQVPFCRADPVLGSQVNVTGTVNVLEAVRRSDGRVRGLSYASSVAVFGPAGRYPGGVADDAAELMPATLYGAYKQANEWTARVYAADWGVGSVGLRPAVVYGPGRDQGLTSDVTKAMLNAAVGRGSHIAFGGASTFQHAEDAARCFVAAARAEVDHAAVHNVNGPTTTIADVVGLIEDAVPEVRGQITVDDAPLPMPQGFDGSGLTELIGEAASQRSLADGVATTVVDFRRLLDAGLVTVD